MPLDPAELKRLQPVKKKSTRPPKISTKRGKGKTPHWRLGKYWNCKQCGRKVPTKSTIGPKDIAKGYEPLGNFICRRCEENANTKG